MPIALTDDQLEVIRISWKSSRVTPRRCRP